MNHSKYMINNFSIFKLKEQSNDPKKPTHSISTKIGEKYEYIGKCWTKSGNDGNKFLSCTLDKPYNDKKGYKVVIDMPIVEDNRTSPTAEFPDGINMDSMPF